MSKIGKWSCVRQIDSAQFSNCPMKADMNFHWERDTNPAAWRPNDYNEWIGKGYFDPNKIQCFLRDSDVDTVDDFYVVNEVMGKFKTFRSDYTGWSVVVKTVIRWEERRMSRTNNWIQIKRKNNNRKPGDIQRWEQENGEFKPSRSSRRNSRRNKQRCAV